MLELADIVREYGDAYRERYGDRILPSQRDALWDIEHCRTAVMGGDVYWCDACQEALYSYHSCGNRHCPKCGGDRADAWRDRQLEHMLPVPYFLVTFTMPHTLNPVAWANQKLVYDLLFRTSTDTLKTLALEPEWIGGKIGTIGALHTWARNMDRHLHVHYLIPGGGIDPTTGLWRPSDPSFFLPVDAMRDVYRAKFRDALYAADPALFAQVPPETWAKEWVVHCKPVGNGESALKYLTPYIYRVALSNRRLISLENGDVTFSYKPHEKPWTTRTLDALSFLHLFLQHVLPKGFHKLRYSGFLHPGARKTLSALQEQLADADTGMYQLPAELASTFGFDQPNVPMTDAPAPDTPASDALVMEAPSTTVTQVSSDDDSSSDETPRTCPHCGGPLRYLGHLPPPYAMEVRAPP